MEDIYIILSKHFSGVSNSEEDRLVSDFRKSDPIEYELLHKLWQKGDIELHDFDSDKAWKNIKAKSNRKVAKTVPIYRNVRRLAAVAAILIISAIITYFLIDPLGPPDMIVRENSMDRPVHVELADGSVVWLNKSAVLSYPEVFTGNFREVSLKGKAYFEITKDRAFPFVIRTNNSEITVLGTSFNINSNQSITEVTVLSGVVEVQSRMSEEKVVVSENYTAVVKNGSLIRYETRNPNYLAWQTGVFEFNNASIIEVVRDLNTYYSNQLEIDTTLTYDCSFTAKFEKEKLEDILEILQTTCDVSVKKVNDIYKIHR